MGTWIAIAIGMFVLGTIMALKPSVVDMRLDKLRMTARRLELNPKVVACPDWVRGRNNEFGKGMIGQYSLIMDDMKFPETHYQVVDGVLKFENTQAQGSNVNSQSSSIDESHSTAKQRLAQRLQGEPLNLPPSMAPLSFKNGFEKIIKKSLLFLKVVMPLVKADLSSVLWSI